MTKAQQIANRFKEVYLNGDWVAATNVKKELSGVNWEEAITKVHNLNTIAALTFHLNYYIAGLLHVFNGGELNIKDEYSFDLAPITSAAEWESLRTRLFSNSEKFFVAVNKMSDDKINSEFFDAKYGTYQRNINCMIEHGYYHLGQVVLIKKMIRG